MYLSTKNGADLTYFLIAAWADLACGVAYDQKISIILLGSVQIFAYVKTKFLRHN